MPRDYGGKSGDVKRGGLDHTPFSEKAPAISRVPARQTGEKAVF
jgi:hypothetical protein